MQIYKILLYCIQILAMNLKDKIYYKYLNLNEFSELVDSNYLKANELGIDTFQKVSEDTLLGRLSLEGKLLYEKEFKNEHLHIMLAKMHFNWSLILDKHLKIKRDEEHRLKMIEREALGGQNYDIVDEPEDTRPTLGQKYGIGNRR